MREVPWKLTLVLLWCSLLTSSCTLPPAPGCSLQATLPKKLLKPWESSAWGVGKAEGKSVFLTEVQQHWVQLETTSKGHQILFLSSIFITYLEGRFGFKRS